MAVYSWDGDKFIALSKTTFSEAGLREREDIQRGIKEDISILDPDIMVVAEEFTDWLDSNRSIDLLCLDREANLVVVELKRTNDAGHAELQAIRYAAMVSPMTFNQLVDVYAKEKRMEDTNEAEAEVLSFLGWEEPQDEEFGKTVRIILASADFNREVTTAVLWLIDRGIDIRCVRLKPYSGANGTLLIDAQQIIPLPEASEYLTRLAHKEDEQRAHASDVLRREFWAGLLNLAREQGAPHGNRTPTKSSWIGGGSGAILNYAIRTKDAQVEIYIDRGNEEDNLRSFEYLEAHKDMLEEITGHLAWDKLPERRACRISQALPGGWKSPKNEWPKIHARFIDAALAMDKAFSDHLEAASNA
jgi:hypothetical protein